jgi:non-ribosomal peptide synthetase component F
VVIGIHRVVERQAAACGESPAYVDATRTLTYRELNSRANALARALMASGFKRGSLAAIRMPASADLVITLLAVLKAGGAYMRIDDDDTSWPRGLSIAERHADGTERCVALDVMGALHDDPQPSPNLPILTRGSDIACVLQDRDGSPAVLVPHSTITTLPLSQPARTVDWADERGELDLWMALMSGATVTLTGAPVETAAA